MKTKGYPQFDFRQAVVRDWWAGHPFTIGPNATAVISGILADGAGPRADANAPDWANFTAAEVAAINAGAVAVINQVRLAQHLPAPTVLCFVCSNNASMLLRITSTCGYVSRRVQTQPTTPCSTGARHTVVPRTSCLILSSKGTADMLNYLHVVCYILMTLTN